MVFRQENLDTCHRDYSRISFVSVQKYSFLKLAQLGGSVLLLVHKSDGFHCIRYTG